MFIFSMKVDQMTYNQSNPPLYIKIKNYLKSNILSDVYSSGDRIPSESKLMENFGVSRITIRKALKELQTEGLIYTMQGKGAFVLKPKIIQDISNLRSLPESINSSKQRLSTILLVAKKVTFNSEVQKQLRSRNGFEVVRTRHINKKAISLDKSYFPYSLRHKYDPQVYSNDIFSSLERCDVLLNEAAISIEAKLADKEIAEKLAIEQGQPVFWVSRLIKDENKKPIVYENLAFRGDSFKYYIDIKRIKSD